MPEEPGKGPPRDVNARAASIVFDDGKFRELVLYIAQQCAPHPLFGATKLNKILFYSDFIAYARLGKPITGAEYVALEHGPSPKRLLPIREDMLMERDIEIQLNGIQERVVALRDPNLERFSPDELGIVETVINALEFRDAESVSELSHHFLGWKAAMVEFLATGQTTVIPYETAHVSSKAPSESEVTAIEVQAGRHGWSFG